MDRFRDRTHAGRLLAERLGMREWREPLVLALPRGGVPVAIEVAKALRAPLEVFVARKVGAPGQPEFGIGAIAEGDVAVMDTSSARAVGVSPQRFDELATHERDELHRRIDRYRGGRPLPVTTGRDVILIDDGLATGVTAEAALRSLRSGGAPLRLVLAVPVGAPSAAARLATLTDEIVCVHRPTRFRSVGDWYEDFAQVGDAEVIALLTQTRDEG